MLASIWADVLKAEGGRGHDNFFEQGGHSLLATQIASRVQKQLQLNVPLRAMFECSTVAELAEYVQGLQGSVLDDDKVDRLSDLMAELEGLWGRVRLEACSACEIERRPRGASRAGARSYVCFGPIIPMGFARERLGA